MTKNDGFIHEKFIRAVPLIIFGCVMASWLHGCRTISVGTYQHGWLASVSPIAQKNYSGVLVYSSPHARQNSIEVKSVMSFYGFVEIRGLESGMLNQPVRQILWPHWLFALVAVPAALCSTGLELRALRRRRRAAAGSCRTCGYALAGIPTNICPECGSPVAAVPYSVVAGAVIATEGFREIDVGARYRLNIVTTPEPAAYDLCPHVRHMNEVMLNWIRLRGRSCEALTFSFSAAPPALEPELISWVLRLVRQNIAERATLDTLQIEVILLKAKGKQLKCICIGTAV